MQTRATWVSPRGRSHEGTGYQKMAHLLIAVPALGFVIAAGTGILVRARRAREDKHARDIFSIGV